MTVPCESSVRSASAREPPRGVLGSPRTDIVLLKASRAKSSTNYRVGDVIREMLGMELLKGGVSSLLVLESSSDMLELLSVIRVRPVEGS